jgi:hypothetical protein
MDRPNFEAALSLEDLEFWRDGLIAELLHRLQLTFASIDPTRSGYGIVDATDPVTADTTSGRPLVVSVNVSDPTTVDVNAGIAICPNGERIIINALHAKIPLANLAGNAQNVVYLYFDEEDSQETGLTHADTLVSLRIGRLHDERGYIRVVTLSDYAVFSADKIARSVPLAVVSIAVTSTGNVLSVDMGNSVLSNNRPWFTAVDLKHRLQLGTGTPTATNPHGTSLSDLSATDGKTLFQLMLDHGMIVGKDLDIAKVPGFVCEEIVLPTAIFTDTTGAFTGVMGARFFRLSRFPVVLLDATNAAKTLDYAVARIPRTNICFFNPGEPWDGAAIHLAYTAVSAAEPPVTPNSISLTLKQPESTEEGMIAGGVAISTVNQPTLSFADAGQVPAVYVAYIDSAGKVDKYPQVIVCQKRLAEVGGALQAGTIPMVGRARIRVALTKAVAGPTLSVTIQLTGKVNGATVTENVTFNSSWVETAYPYCGEVPTMHQTTSTVFDEFTSWLVLSRTNDGPLSEVLIWAMVDPVTTPELADILPVADVQWDALKACIVEDIRPIDTKLSIPRSSKFSDGARSLAQLTPVLNGSGFLFNHWLEDFNAPYMIGRAYYELSPTVEPGVQSTDIRKIGDGLDRRSLYVGRPVPVKPHSVSPVAIRFIPIEPSRDFTFRVRVMIGTTTWSRWFTLSDLTAPLYTLQLGALGAAPLRKWQMVVHGAVRAMVVVYLTSAADPGIGLVYDSGAYDEGSYT